MTPARRDAVVVPAAPVLLPENRSLVDPVPQVRAAAERAVNWLVARHPEHVVVVGAALTATDEAHGVGCPASLRVARSLLAAAGFIGRLEEHPPAAPLGEGADAGLLVVADGTACRDPEAPGRLDPRAAGFDETIETALRGGDPGTLRTLDDDLARTLLCSGVPALRVLGRCVAAPRMAELDYSGHPYGVQYWVVRWSHGAV